MEFAFFIVFFIGLVAIVVTAAKILWHVVMIPLIGIGVLVGFFAGILPILAIGVVLCIAARLWFCKPRPCRSRWRKW